MKKVNSISLDDDLWEGNEMKPPAFEYRAPTQLDDTLKMLYELVREQNRDVKLLAGGQSLIPILNMRLAHPELIVDLNLLEPQLSYVHIDGDVLRIGAMTRQYLLKTHTSIERHCPIIAEAVNLIGHAAILTRGTIGGSLVHADPAAELPLVFVTLGGSVTLCSADSQREIDASEFFLTHLTANIKPEELLTEIALPVIPARSGQAIEEFSMRHGDFALVAAAAQVTLDADSRLQMVRLGIGGAGSTPIDCSHVLASLLGEKPSEANVRETLRGIVNQLDPPEDLHASAQYRVELAQTMAYRALERAIKKALALHIEVL